MLTLKILTMLALVSVSAVLAVPNAVDSPVVKGPRVAD